MPPDKIRMIMVTDFSTKFHQIGLYVLASLLIGAIIGGYASMKIVDWQLSNAVTYKAIKIDGKDYNLNERP